VTPNALLLWMSARSEGSWQQFRAAVEELHLPSEAPGSPDDDAESSGLRAYWRLRLNMQRFGHAEFAAGAAGADWRVAPPTLAMHQRPGHALGVLVGARSDALMARIAASAGSASIQTYTADLYPDQILVSAPDQNALQIFADAAGIRAQAHAPTALLLSIPRVDDRTVRRRADIPMGADWKIERFSATTLGWSAASREDLAGCRAGLFRFSALYRRQTILCLHGLPYSVPGQVGKYAILARRRRWVVRYDASHEQLSVPASCRPPFLIERSLVLCSGRPPGVQAQPGGSITLFYDGVPRAAALLASGVLRQELKE
jgi:hypothetical protein